jgi:hypothetical protein
VSSTSSIRSAFGGVSKEFKETTISPWEFSIEENTSFLRRSFSGRKKNSDSLSIERTETFNFAELPPYNNEYANQAENLKDLFTGQHEKIVFKNPTSLISISI